MTCFCLQLDHVVKCLVMKISVLRRMEDTQSLLIDGRSSAMCWLMRNQWSFLEGLQMSFWCMVLTLKERSKLFAFSVLEWIRFELKLDYVLILIRVLSQKARD